MAALAEPRHQPIALSLWGTLVPTGIALAGLATAEFTDDAGWRMIFAVNVVLLAAALIAALLAVPFARGTRLTNPRRRERYAPPSSWRPRSSASLCFSWRSPACCRRGWSNAAGLPPRTPGRYVAVATACGIAGSLLAGSLMRAGFSPGRLAAVGLLASTALAALGLAILPLALAVAGLALSFALGGLVPAAVFASVPLVAVNARAIGPINGLLAQAGSLGSLAGPPVLALWVRWVGWPSAPVMLLVIAVIGAACALAVRAPKAS